MRAFKNFIVLPVVIRLEISINPQRKFLLLQLLQTDKFVWNGHAMPIERSRPWTCMHSVRPVAFFVYRSCKNDSFLDLLQYTPNIMQVFDLVLIGYELQISQFTSVVQS